MPNITDTFSVFHDRIIVSDLIMSGSFMPPAGEYRHLDPPLPLEQIILTDLVLEPVGVSHPSAPSTESQEAPDTATPQQESPAAPIFLQRLDLEMQEKIFDMLPPEADLIDETIALFEPRKAGIFILTQYGWVKEENGVGTQTIRLIQYLRRIGKRPGQPCASLTELAGVLAKRAASMRTARSSVSNRIIRIEEICMERNLKPILIQSAGLWRINPQLTHWDEVKTKPWVHN